MTTDEMPEPDVFYLDWESKSDMKLYRAEPVDALLKQARDALDSWDEDFAPAPNNYLDLIDAINKFLEGK